MEKETQNKTLTFEELSKLTWGIADIIRDEMDGDTRDYMEITLPLLLTKRLLDIREEYVENVIKKSFAYELEEDLLKALESEKNKAIIYNVTEENPEIYFVTWEDLMNFQDNPNGDSVKINTKNKDISLYSNSRTKQEFLDEIVNSFSHPVIHKIFEASEFAKRIENTNKLKDSTFKKIINQLGIHPFNYKNAPSDVFSDVYMYLIAQFAESAGKKAGEFFTPYELCRGGSRLLDIKLQPDRVTKFADITSGSATLMTVAADKVKEIFKNEGKSDEEAEKEMNERAQFYIQEKTEKTLILGEMNLLLKHVTSFKSYNANSITEYEENIGENRNQIDYILGNPPYGLKDYGIDYFGPEATKKKYNHKADERRWWGGIPPKSEGEFAFMMTNLDMLNETGKGLLYLPLGTLFKDSTAKLREEILKSDWLEGLVLLPSSMFMTTGIPVVMWIFNKNKNEEDKNKVFMVNASEEFIKNGKYNEWVGEAQDRTINTYLNREEIEGFSKYVDIEDIEENGWNLSVHRYVFKEIPEEVIDIAEVMKESLELEADISKDQSYMNDLFSQIVSLKG